MTTHFITLTFIFTSLLTFAQTKVTTLKADGPGDTYQLIDSILAPNKGSAIESPGTKTGDCDNHSNYINADGNANHITEVNDPQMGPVFKFTLHAKEDIDRNKCEKKDRQRNEIKTYRSSPDYLKATLGEKIEYKWNMKLPNDFKAFESFTHFHQIKSVDAKNGGDKMPLITFTTYKKSSGEFLNIRYGPVLTQETLAKIPLSEFKGNWVEFKETIDFKKGKKGTYQLLVKNLKSKKTILDFEHRGVMFKEGASLMRPKWGIYRSLKYPNNIKDEEVLFGEFKITELVSKNPN